MAWNAQLVLALFAVAVSAGPAAAQVALDDYSDDTPAPLTVGTTHGRFDHRWPRTADVDLFRLSVTPGRMYRTKLIVEHPAPDQPWASNTYFIAPYAFEGIVNTRILHPGPYGDSVFNPGANDTLIVVEGLAQRDGTSVPYSIVVEDLGPPVSDPLSNPQDAPTIALGEWYDGILTVGGDAYWNAFNDIDVVKVPTVAGRRYAVQLEALDTDAWRVDATFFGYADAQDPRFPVYTNLASIPFGRLAIDAIVDGSLVVAVRGSVGSLNETLHYRVRVVDSGPAQLDDHADWDAGATPLQLGTPVEFTLNDSSSTVYGWPPPDIDCFSIEMAQGRRYDIKLSPAPGSLDRWSGGSLGVFRDGRHQPFSIPTEPGVAVFKPAQTAVYTLRCYGDSRTVRRELEVIDLGPADDDYPDYPVSTTPAHAAGSVSGILSGRHDTDLIRIDAPSGSIVFASLVGEAEATRPIEVSLDIAYPFDGVYGQPLIRAGSTFTLPGAGVVYEVEGSSVYLRVTLPLGSAEDTVSYAINFAVVLPGSVADDWPDTTQGAIHIQPGDEPRWARGDHPGDIDVFTVDLVAGHGYRLTGSAIVLPVSQTLTPSVIGSEQATTFIQPTLSGRYQLVYTGPVNQVWIRDDGPMPDDFISTGPLRKVSQGASVHGRSDFLSDIDAWLVQATDDGVYEIEFTAPPGAAIRFGGEGGAVFVFTEFSPGGVDGANTTVTRRFSTPVSFGAPAPIWVEVSGMAAGTEYTVTVRLIDPFRSTGDATAQSPAALTVNEWVAARPPIGDDAWFRVPVAAGRRYAVVFDRLNVFMRPWVGVSDPMGTFFGEYGTQWVAGASGDALIRLQSWGYGCRFRVEDRGPASDDFAATIEAAPERQLRTEIHGHFDFPSDVDSFRLPLEPSLRYAARLTLPEGVDSTAVRWSDGDSRPHYPHYGWNPLWGAAWFSFTHVNYIDSGEPFFSLMLDESVSGFDGPIPYTLTVWPFCAADLAGPGATWPPDGRLDNNDFVAFINSFFISDQAADVGRAPAAEGPDDRLDNNDFIVYIDRFFAGCP